MSAGISAALDPHYDQSNAFIGTSEAAIVGGTVSQLTGGKFGNGAVTSAFAFAFNAALHSEKNKPKTNSDGTTPVDGWRYLTDGEKTLIASEALNVKNIDDVHVVRGGYKGFENDIITPNGNIYVGTKNLFLKWSEDYSREDIQSRSVLLHESVHLYQHNTLGWGLARMGINRMRNSNYDYVISSGKSFSDYGMEEQAEMVQDRYLLKNGQSHWGINASTLQQLRETVP